MDLTVIQEKLGIPLSWRRNPKLKREKVWAALVNQRLAAMARVSDDRDGKQKSVTEQVTEICKVALERYSQDQSRFRIYTDNSISASDFGEERPEWEELCAVAATFGAVDVLPVWAINRFSRVHTEGLQFMWLCWINDVRILVIKDYLEDVREGGDGSSGIYNLRRSKDWEAVDKAFKDAEQESQSKANDITRGHEGNRENGKLGGGVPGGWIRKYDPVTRAPHTEVVLAQAKVLVRQLRLLAVGSAPSTVAWRLNQDDVPPFTRTKKDGTPCRTRETGRWEGHAVQVTALNPAHIGMIRKMPPRKGGDLWDLRPAADYFPIVRGPRVDEEWTEAEREELDWHGTEEEFIQLWEDARAKVKLLGQVKPETNGYRDGKAAIIAVRSGGSKHLQSFLSQCDVCGGPVRMAMYQRQNGHYYYLTCEKSGHVSVREDWADAALTELVIDKLCRLTREGGFSPEDAGKLKENLDEQQRKAAYWDSMISFYKDEAGDAGATIQAERDKAACLAGLRADAEKLRIPVVIREFMECKGDRDCIAAKWAAKDTSAKRATLKGLVRAIRVSRSPLTKAQALRLPEDDRKQVARGQVAVDWRDEFKQAGDECRAVESASIRILEVPEGWKLCGGECREAKPADGEHFYADKSRADGWSNPCKPCFRARSAAYRRAR